MSGNHFEPALLHQVQQLERSPGRLLLTDLPLLHRGQADVEQAGKDRLADPRGFADVLDLLGCQRLHGWQAQTVELAQGDLI